MNMVNDNITKICDDIVVEGIQMEIKASTEVVLERGSKYIKQKIDKYIINFTKNSDDVPPEIKHLVLLPVTIRDGRSI